MVVTRNAGMSRGAWKTHHSAITNKKKRLNYPFWRKSTFQTTHQKWQNNKISSTTMKEAHPEPQTKWGQGFRMKHPYAQLSSLWQSCAEIIVHSIHCTGNEKCSKISMNHWALELHTLQRSSKLHSTKISMPHVARSNSWKIMASVGNHLVAPTSMFPLLLFPSSAMHI